MSNKLYLTYVAKSEQLLKTQEELIDRLFVLIDTLQEENDSLRGKIAAAKQEISEALETTKR